MFTTEYEDLDLSAKYKFDQEFFYTLAESLGNRNLNYSLLDQVIFGCHMYEDQHINQILDTFPKAKIIRIIPNDDTAWHIILELQAKKIKDPENKNLPVVSSSNDPRVLEIPFGGLFTKINYLKHYDRIINFLNLNGRLICFDYVQYYLTRQGPEIAKTLEDYSKTV